MITPVILCGGSGTRLWPMSRKAYPKQLLPLVGDRSLLQDTLLRAMSIPDVSTPLIICNEEHRFLVAEQCQEIGLHHANIILESVGKNTAPAAAMASLYLQSQKKDDFLLLLPADHLIKDMTAFVVAVQNAKMVAKEGKLVTFGVDPTKPETGYGYIKKAESLCAAAGYRVAEFVEKPDILTAEKYIASGNYFWNSGIFLFRVNSFLAELKIHAPDILAVCEKTLSNITIDMDFIRLDKIIFESCPSNSIDYAVMEKTQNAAVVPLKAEWNDIGSWTALWEVNESDSNGNVIRGDVITEGVTHSYLHAENRMLAVVGVEDHVIVETADAVLVAHKDHCQSIKHIVAQLKQKNRSEIHLHRRVYRPWGFYETIDQSTYFQVKRITVKPGASLSLQMHHHRSEHWVVVKGIARVTRNEDVFSLLKNQSTYIPVGTKHRLENNGTEPLEIIEVQSGDYLGEDDIVRFEDVYGRETLA